MMYMFSSPQLYVSLCNLRTILTVSNLRLGADTLFSLRRGKLIHCQHRNNYTYLGLLKGKEKTFDVSKQQRFM